MKIDFKYSAIVFSDETDIYNVNFIIVDEDEKTIECNDEYGFVIANIHYKDSKNCGFIPDGKDGRKTGEIFDLVENGKLVYTKGD